MPKKHIHNYQSKHTQLKGSVCVCVWCRWETQCITASNMSQQAEKWHERRRKPFFPTSRNIFPLLYKELLCGERAGWEISEQWKSFPGKPAALCAGLTFILYSKHYMFFYCGLCPHSELKELISRVTRKSTALLYFCAFTGRSTHAHTSKQIEHDWKRLTFFKQ